MPRSVQQTTPRGHPHHKKKKPVVTTVHPSGKITGGTKKSRAKARGSVKRVKRLTSPRAPRIARPGYTPPKISRGPHKGSDALGDVLGVAKSAYEAVQQSGREAGEDVRKHGYIHSAVTKQAPVIASPVGEAAVAVKAAKVAENIGSEAKAVKAQASLVEKAANKAKAAAKKKVHKAKTTPQRVKTAPKRAVKKVKRTPQAAKEAAQHPGRTASKAGKTAAKHPIRTTGAAAAAVPPGVETPGDINKRVQSFLRGNVAAATHPGQYLKTTARAIPGFVTVPVGIAAETGLTVGRAASSAAHTAGIPGAKGYSGKEIAAPVVEEYRKQRAGLEDFASKQFSTDPKVVEKSSLTEYGATPLIGAVPAGKLVGKVTKGRVTGAIRRGAERAREAKGKEHGDFAGTPHVLESKRQRTETSKEVARARQAARNETAERARKIKHEGQKAKGGKYLRTVPRGKRRTRKVKVHTGDLANILARKGINPEDPAAIERIKDVAANLEDPRKMGHELNPATVHTRDILAYALENPERLHDPHLINEVHHYLKQDRYAREHPELSPDSSERARLLPTANTYRILYPEHRHPASVRDIMHTPEKFGQLSKDTMRREAHRDKLRAKKLRRKAATADKQARIMGERLDVRRRLTRRPLSVAEKDRLLRGERTDIRNANLERRIAKAQLNARDLRELADRMEEQGKRKTAAANDEAAKLNGKQRPDEARQAEFEQEVNAHISATPGLREPAWTPTGTSKMQPSTGSTFSRIPGKSKFREGTADLHGIVDESLHQLLNAGIAVPVARRHIFEAVRRVGAHRIKIGGRTRFDSTEATRMLTDGTINPNTHVQMSVPTIQRVHDFLKGKVDEYPDSKWVQTLRAELKQQNQDELLRTSTSRQVEIWPRARAQELESQLEHHIGDVQHTLMKVNRATSFLILGTSPAWAAMQIPAEYGQAALQHSRLLNPVWVHNAIRAYREMDPHQRQKLEASTGTTHRVVETDNDIQLALSTAEGDVATGYGVFQRYALGRTIRRLPQTIRGIDNFKGGRIRTLTAIARADEMANPFTHYLKGIGGMDRSMAEYFKATRGMSRKERLDWIVENPEFSRKLGQNVDESLGNWTALSSRERPAALAGIFYPFVRMSLRWIFHDFPKNHPVRFAISYYLGQQNANEIKKLLNGDPSFFTQWGMVPFHTGGGTSILDLSRIAPGSNALVEGLAGHEGGPWGTAALRLGQPAIVSGVTAATGVDPLSGKQEPKSGIQALNQLAALSPLSRNAETLLTTAQGYVRSDDALKLLGSKEAADSLSRLFDKLKGTRKEQLVRGLAMPAAPQKVELLRDANRAGRALSLMSKTGSDAHDALKQDTGLPIAKAERKSAQMWKDYDKAQSVLHHLYQKYQISYKAEEERYSKRSSAIDYPDTGSSSSSSSGGGGGTAIQSIFGAGGGGATTVKRKPQTAIQSIFGR